MKLTLIFLIFSFTSSFAQKLKTNKNDSFLLRGRVVGRDTGRIFLSYFNSEEKGVADTTYLKRGYFKFKGEINQPTYAGIKGYSKVINFDEVNYVGIFLEPGKQTISLVEQNYKDAIMKGSYSQMEYDSLKMKFDSIELKWKRIDDECVQVKKNVISHPEDTLSKIKFDSLRAVLKAESTEMKTAGIVFITHHPNSVVSAYFLGIYVHGVSIDSAEFLYSQLTPEVKNSRYGYWDKTEINKIKQSSTGVVASNFSVKDIKGQEISLPLLKGKFILLNFWASWCVPCREEIPLFKKIYNEYHLKGFEIVAISIDRDIQDWKKTIKKENIGNWYNVLVNESISKNYPNVNQPIPSQILIDKEGKIIWRSDDKTRKDDLESVLKKQID
ncbi:MAG: TlpA disulfide reductase family protein [Ginsengibacter sp.]